MSDLKQYLIEEAVEDYAQGRLTRRQAMSALAGLTGTIVASQLLAGCKKKDADEPPGEAPATGTATGSAPSKPPTGPTASNSVPATDPDIVGETVQFPGDGATLSGYLARPSKTGTFPIVLVCHENRGLTAHIEDVTRRVAKAGHVALAVDLLSREGGTAKHGYDDVPGVLGAAPPERHVKDFLSGLAHARTLPSARGDRVGMTGFCFGGGMTWRVAAALPDLRAAVPFYGPPIDAAQVPSIQAAVLAIYAEQDDRVNAGIPAVEAAMGQHGKTFRKIIYPGTQHAFHNDTRERYNADAARAAWDETLAWFAKYLA